MDLYHAENMPYRECFLRSTLPKLVDDHHSSGKNKDWSPKSSQVNARERLRFQTYSDTLSGGIQYWHKHKTKPNESRGWHSTGRSTQMSLNLPQHSKCAKCGGLLSDQINLRTYFHDRNSCAFGKQYCDVIGPCADCCLTAQRNAIVEKQTVEFPGLEVTPRRLVAPALVQVMMSKRNQENMSEHDQSQQTKNVLELPPISLDTLKYMRREAGSSKHKRNTFIDEEEKTFKKYIEIRLPKI